MRIKGCPHSMTRMGAIRNSVRCPEQESKMTKAGKRREKTEKSMEKKGSTKPPLLTKNMKDSTKGVIGVKEV